MGFASHLGPWLLGTVKNTTGTTPGTIRNMGATIVGQADPVSFNDPAGSVAAVIPAGAIITNIALYSSTTFVGTTPSVTVAINGTTIATATLTSGTAFNGSLTLATTAAAGALLSNVGSTDATVTYTVGGTALSAGVGTLLIEYMVRNSDGTQNPAQV